MWARACSVLLMSSTYLLKDLECEFIRRLSQIGSVKTWRLRLQASPGVREANHVVSNLEVVSRLENAVLASSFCRTSISVSSVGFHS